MTARVRLVFMLVAFTASVVAVGPALAQGMLGSKHNLSVSGPGPVRAISESQICVFCHTPHNASPRAPLWNRNLSGQSYTPYASGSLQATVGQPNGYSRLCLSCHDGSIAVGSVVNLGGHSATVQMQGTPDGAMPVGSTRLGTNLTNDHPVSFAFSAAVASADGELVSPSLLTGAIKLYEGATAGQRDSVQCTTCHDPHLTVNPKFLKRTFIGRTDNLCLTCHIKPGWSGSSHEAATAKFFPSGSSTSVADLSCGGCHTPHTKSGAPRLLRDAATDAGAAAIQLACYRCHASTTDGGITWDLKTVFNKTKRHPVGVYAGHNPIFTVATPAETVANTAKHVECPDCHNPHRTRARGTAGTGGVFEGMRGVDLAGNVVQDITQDRNIAEYEVCFRCHADNYATVIGALVQADPSGTIPASNKRTEFQTTNSSYHPVAGAGKNTSSNLNTQLSEKGLSTSAVIKCSDCHNNDYYSGSAFQGVVSQYNTVDVRYPKGPHGSDRFNLLRARMWNALPGPGSTFNSANFDLCFHCHRLERLMQRKRSDSPGARTNFYSTGTDENLHWLHLDNRIGASRPVCKSCHYNVHSNAEASNTQYRVTTSGDCSTGTLTTDPEAVPLSTTRLINFHPNIQKLSNRSGKPEWCFNTATRERKCFLQCHQPNGNTGGVNMGGNGCSGLSNCRTASYTPSATGDIQ